MPTTPEETARAFKGIFRTYLIGISLAALFHFTPDGPFTTILDMAFWLLFSGFILVFLKRIARLSDHPKWLTRCRGAVAFAWGVLAYPIFLAVIGGLSVMAFGEKAGPFLDTISEGRFPLVNLGAVFLGLALKVRISQMCGILGIVGKSKDLREKAGLSIRWLYRAGGGFLFVAFVVLFKPYLIDGPTLLFYGAVVILFATVGVTFYSVIVFFQTIGLAARTLGDEGRWAFRKS